MKLWTRYRHKNSRFLYFARNLASLAVPRSVYRRRLGSILGTVDGFDAAYVRDRVDYCNRVGHPFRLGPAATTFRLTLGRKAHNYFLDLHEYMRYFEPDLRLHYRFGDGTEVPPEPTIVKARPIGAGNEHSVLLNLNKVRHFIFVKDGRDFRSKRDKLVWRGKANREHRTAFLATYHDSPLCDVGHTGSSQEVTRWRRPFLSIEEQLQYKFILSMEGNDVATNLKWIMSSNSLCFMRRPRFETWFMEGRLVPDHHYVLLRDDYADLLEKIRYWAGNPEAAERLIGNAKAHVAQFRDREREDLISLLVLRKYFVSSGQLEPSALPG